MKKIIFISLLLTITLSLFAQIVDFTTYDVVAKACDVTIIAKDNDYRMIVGSVKKPKLLKSMCEHFVVDEHYCYFDDMYSPEYTMQWIYEAIQKHNIDAESQALLEEGYKEILQSECYKEYGSPSYIER